MKKDLWAKLEKAHQEQNKDLFFQLLFDKFGNFIIAWAESFGLEHDRAFEPEDILIEVFIRVSKKGLKAYPPERFSTLGAFIYKVTQNILRTNYRNGKKFPQDSLDDNLPPIQINVLIEHHSLEFDDLLNHLLGQIKPREAAVFRLNLDGASHKEIAEALGISEVNSRQYLSQAKRKLKVAALKYFQSLEKP